MPRWMLLVAWTVVCASGCGWAGGAQSETLAARHTAGWLEQMDEVLLAGPVSTSLVVEVDWVQGRPPSGLAVDSFLENLRRFAPPGREVELNLDEAIPQQDWETSDGRDGLLTFVAEHVDLSADDASELLYVLYVPSGRGWYDGDPVGMYEQITIRGSEAERDVRTLLLFTDRIRGESLLWVGAAKIERAILMHELGHALGLVSNADHEQKRWPGHCRTTGCVMHRPHAGSWWRNAWPTVFAGRVPFEYCRRCVADIQRAKTAWRIGPSAH